MNRLCAIIVVFVCNVHFSLSATNVHIYVSPNGSDNNDGLHINEPFRTINKAVSVLTNHTLSGKNVYIELLQGNHDLETELHIKPHHANSVTVRSYTGQEAHVTGGRRVPTSGFKPVTDPIVLSKLSESAKHHVKVIHLPDFNITNYGTMMPYGGYKRRTAPLELFYNSEPLHIARWPNDGFINVVGTPDGQNGLRFQYNSSRPNTWHNDNDIWTYGYWYWSWSDSAIKIKHIDIQSKIVTLEQKSNFGLRKGHWSDDNTKVGFPDQGGYFRFLNILEELDTPGEYYLDRTKGDLFVWLPSPDGNTKSTDVIYVSLLNTCITLQRHTKNVVFTDFTLEACRGAGINGQQVQNTQILNMEVRNTGAENIQLGHDSRNCRVARNLLHHGDGGVFINGGNRATLESSGNSIEDNEIFHYARVGAVGYSGIKLDGMGNLARYNHIYIGKYDGIRYNGNDNVMEYNHIHHVCVNASDCGALHTGRDWTTRGNIIRHNIVHDVLRLVPGADVRGVMLDDQSSSTSITENVFYNNYVHVNIGGGRDNIVADNVMYNATIYTMQIDGRGVSLKFNKDLYTKLYHVPYNSTLWTSRYPALINFNHQNRSLPQGNQIDRNVVYNTGNQELIHGLVGWLDTDTLFNVTRFGFAQSVSDFMDPSNGDLRIKCYAADWANRVNFPQVLTPNNVGPRYDVGPYYNLKVRSTTMPPMSHGACTTKAPTAVASPMVAYLPDGSGNNQLFNVSSNEGCWLNVAKCTNHPEAVGTWRDTDGESHSHALDNETMCFKRAVNQWHYCGTHKDEQVVAIYAPTGATRLAGDGCFMAIYGCPKHGGPTDGHVTTGRIYRDAYAEQHLGAATNEANCLNRAHGQWQWCGGNANHTVTSIYRPTGSVRTAGSGCWIHVHRCPKHPTIMSMFYDAWGATNVQSDSSEFSCLSQAEYYWQYCGGDVKYPVTAFYRPTTQSKMFP